MKFQIFLIFLFLQCLSLRAQTWMSLRYNHIFGGSNYSNTIATGSFLGSAIYWSGTTPIQFKVTNPSFVNTINPSYNFLASNIFVQIDNIGGSLPGSSAFQGTVAPLAPLGTNAVTLFTPKGGLFDNRPTGTVNMRYTIGNAAIQASTWRQGEYRNTREYTTYTSGSLRYFTPVSERIILEVDAILNWLQAPEGGTLNIPGSIFDFFRNESGLTITYSATLATTMPYRLSFRANSGTILKDGSPAVPDIPLNVVSASGNDRSVNRSFSSLPLSSSSQELSAGTDIDIGTRNRNTLSFTLRISKEKLLQHFFSPGVYRLPAINLTANATATATTYNEPGGVKSLSYDLAPLQLNIPAQQQIILANSSDITFAFNSVESFEPTQEQTASRTFRFSSNIDYSIYVRAQSPAFVGPNGVTIPLDVLELSSECENGSAQQPIAIAGCPLSPDLGSCSSHSVPHTVCESQRPTVRQTRWYL